MDDSRYIPPSIRRGRRQTSLGALSNARRNAKEMRNYAQSLRRTAAAIREIGGDRKVLVSYIADHPEYVDAMRKAWRKALYGPSAMTQWFAENTRDPKLKGIEGYPQAGVPVDTGALQDSLTDEDAEGAISDVLISRDGKITFRYGAAPQRQYAPFEQGSTKEDQMGQPFDPNETYLEEINLFYSDNSGGFFEIGLEEMGKSARLQECVKEIGNIMSAAAAAYIKEKSK